MTSASSQKARRSRRAQEAPTGRLLSAETAALAGLLALAVIGWVDYATGPDIRFSLVYLVPVAWASWRHGRRVAIVVAIGASTAWFIADFALREVHYVAISMWNGITRLGVFMAIGIL